MSKISILYYLIRLLLFTEGVRRPGVPIKVSTIHLEHLPLTLFIHKILDGTGNMMYTLDSLSYTKILEIVLGVHMFARYEHANL